jgi:hypothetical protein
VSTVPVSVERSGQSTAGTLVDVPPPELDPLAVSPPVDDAPDAPVVDEPPVDDEALPVPESVKQPTPPAVRPRLVK